MTELDSGSSCDAYRFQMLSCWFRSNCPGSEAIANRGESFVLHFIHFAQDALSDHVLGLAGDCVRMKSVRVFEPAGVFNGTDITSLPLPPGIGGFCDAPPVDAIANWPMRTSLNT